MEDLAGDMLDSGKNVNKRSALSICLCICLLCLPLSEAFLQLFHSIKILYHVKESHCVIINLYEKESLRQIGIYTKLPS